MTYQAWAWNRGRAERLGMGTWPSCQAALPTPDMVGLAASLSHATSCHCVRWGGSDWWLGRQGPGSRPKLVSCFPAYLYAFLTLSMDGWCSFSVGQVGTLIILLGSPPLMPTLPPALITDSFLEESVLSEQGSGYFLPKYILTFLCKEEADRDQRINSPTTCPSSLIRGI